MSPSAHEPTTLADMLSRRRRADDVRVSWSADRWTARPVHPTPGRVRLSGSAVIERLAERATASGLLRSDVTDVAAEPVDLLIAAMAWGFGVRGYGPARTAKMLDTDGVDEAAADIIDTTLTTGAGPGFSALFKTNGSGRISGLAVAMGSKLLYFACRGDSLPARGPRPMIYDQWVFAGLALLPENERPRLRTNGSLLPSPAGRVSQEAYEAWCQWAADRATDHGVMPDDVEFALFAEGSPDL